MNNKFVVAALVLCLGLPGAYAAAAESLLEGETTLAAVTKSKKKVRKPARTKKVAVAPRKAPAAAPVVVAAPVVATTPAPAPAAAAPAEQPPATAAPAPATTPTQTAAAEPTAGEPVKTENPAPASEPISTEKLAQVCGACHGADGNSVVPETPSLAGQTARYLYLQLKDFKEKRRENPLMTPLTANLDKAQMLALAQYYAEKKLKSTGFKVDEAKLKLGKAKADEVLCTMCHMGGFLGQNEIPRVAGQRYDYIVKQLKDFKAMKRTNDAGNMTSVSKTLSDEDIDNLAQYLTNLN